MSLRQMSLENPLLARGPTKQEVKAEGVEKRLDKLITVTENKNNLAVLG
jgi:hypothetical protein